MRAILASLLLCLAACQPTSSEARRVVASPTPGPLPLHNVLVIRVDDMAWQDLQTLKPDGFPVLDQTTALIGAHGTTFVNFIQAPVCCQSRCSFITGQRALHTGIYGNLPPMGGFDEFHPTSTLTTWMHDAGYRTGHLGKYINGYLVGDGVQPDWDEWFTTEEHEYLDYDVNDNGAIVHMAGQANYHTDAMTKRALKFIRTNNPQPFFLLIDYLAPHQQFPPVAQSTLPIPAARHLNTLPGLFTPGPSFNEADCSDKPQWVQDLPFQSLGNTSMSLQRRSESLLAVDEGISRIMATLENRGLLVNTAVIFVSDNGWHYGTHKVLGKETAYEETTRCPLIIVAPWLSGQQVVTEPVANIDLASTILELAGLPSHAGQDGQSMVPLIMNPASTTGRTILLESDILTMPRAYTGVRSADFTWVEYTNGDRELYPLQIDPFELDSQHGNSAYGPTIDALHTLLLELSTP